MLLRENENIFLNFRKNLFGVSIIILHLHLPNRLSSLEYREEVLLNTNAKIAQLVERHLAKVEVAGSNPVFRSESKIFFLTFAMPTAEVVELVDTLDLKSNGL